MYQRTSCNRFCGKVLTRQRATRHDRGLSEESTFCYYTFLNVMKIVSFTGSLLSKSPNSEIPGVFSVTIIVIIMTQFLSVPGDPNSVSFSERKNSVFEAADSDLESKPTFLE